MASQIHIAVRCVDSINFTSERVIPFDSKVTSLEAALQDSICHPWIIRMGVVVTQVGCL